MNLKDRVAGPDAKFAALVERLIPVGYRNLLKKATTS